MLTECAQCPSMLGMLQLLGSHESLGLRAILSKTWTALPLCYLSLPVVHARSTSCTSGLSRHGSACGIAVLFTPEAVVYVLSLCLHMALVIGIDAAESQ